MKRSKFKPPWFRCSHVTELPSGKRLFCQLSPKHEGVHERLFMGRVVTWGTKEPNKRWDY